MKNKLLASLVIGSAFIILSGVFIQHTSASKQKEFYSKKYELLTKLRKNAVNAYFDTVKGELLFWSQSKRVKDASVMLSNAWLDFDGDPKKALQQLYIHDNPFPPGERRQYSNANDQSQYSELHDEFHGLGKDLIEKRGYYDFFLIDELGNIVYTVEKENDFATNLAFGKYADSGLAQAFTMAIQDPDANTHVVDFQPYAPSNNAPAVFMARRLLDDDGLTIGVVAVQLDINEITKIMLFRGGVGETGETYLVGNDKLMRSNSRFSDEPTVLKTKVDTAAVVNALNGKTGITNNTNYRGQESMAAYDYFSLGDFRWAIISEISITEIEASNSVSKAFVFIGSFITIIIGVFGTWLSSIVRRDDGEAAQDLINDVIDN